MTCVELARQPDGPSRLANDPVAHHLFKETVSTLAGFEPKRVVPAGQFKRLLGTALAPLIFLLLLLATARPWTTRLLTGLYAYTVPLSYESLWLRPPPRLLGVTVTPGTVEVARGASVDIQAQFDMEDGFQSETQPVLFVAQTGQSPIPQTLTGDPNGPDIFFTTIHQVDTPLEYQVVWDVDRDRKLASDTYRITTYDPPAIRKITTSIRPPAYTGLEEVIKEGTRISVLEGTELRIHVSADKALDAAVLSAEAGREWTARIQSPDPNQPAQMAVFELTATENQRLRVLLTDKSLHNNINPPEIVIRVHEDRAPRLKVHRPGADWSVHRIAEVDLTVEVTDDYGVEQLILELRKNDEAVQKETLYSRAPSIKPQLKRQIDHRFHLEQRDIEVGDIITYRWMARDTQPDPNQGQAWSQPFFLFIRPFTQTILKSKSTAAGMGGPPPPSQREIIVATLRLIDTMSQLETQALVTQCQDLQRSQRQVRVQTRLLRDKMKFAHDVKDLRRRLQHLDQALASMQEAETQLSKVKPQAALAPEHDALHHVKAALAGLPIHPLTTNNAAGSPYSPNPSMSLAGQRMEITRDKYELYDLPPCTLPDSELVEALERIRRLGARHKEFMETLKREKMEAQAGSGMGTGGQRNPDQQDSASSDPSARWEQMRKEVSDSQYELERLREKIRALQSIDPETRGILEEALEEALAELHSLNESLTNKNTQGTEGANTRVLDELLTLQLKLKQAQTQGARATLEELDRRLDGWIQAQEQLIGQTQGLAQAPPPAQNTQREQTAKEQQQLGQALQQEAAALAEFDKSNDRALAPSLEKLTQALSRIDQWMQQAAGHLRQTQDQEAQLAQQAALAGMMKAKKELTHQLNQYRAHPLNRMAQALTTVQSLKNQLAERLHPPPEAGAGNTAGLFNPPDARGQDTPPPREGQAPRTMHSLLSIRFKLEQVADLLPQDPLVVRQVADMVRTVALYNGEGRFDSPESMEMLGTLVVALYQLEGHLFNSLEMLDQIHRLQQVPQEKLDPAFRDMAARYFQALSENAAKQWGKR